MSDVYQALNDLNWLSDRLKGLMALSEDIKTYDTLKDQTKDMSLQLEQQKQEHATWEEKIKQLKDKAKSTEAEIQKKLEDHDTKHQGIIAKAKTDSIGLVEKANVEVAAIREALKQEKASYEDRVAKLKEQKTALEQEVSSHTSTLDKLKGAIENIKAKF